MLRRRSSCSAICFGEFVHHRGLVGHQDIKDNEGVVAKLIRLEKMLSFSLGDKSDDDFFLFSLLYLFHYAPSAFLTASIDALFLSIIIIFTP